MAKNSPIRSRWWLWAALALVIVVHTAVQLSLSLSRENMLHDEAFSMLGAAGNWEPFYALEAASRGEWVEAEAFQALLVIDSPFDFPNVSAGLLANDLHPPLYFYMLRVWAFFFGNTVEAGLVFNLLLKLILVGLMFGFARRIMGDATHTGAVMLVWLGSVVPIALAIEIRHYTLFPVMSVVYAWGMYAVFFEQRRLNVWRVVWVMGSGIGGLMTHFSFGVLVIGVGVTLWVRYLAWDRGALWRYVRLYLVTHSIIAVLALLAFDPRLQIVYNYFVRDQRAAVSDVSLVRNIASLWYHFLYTNTLQTLERLSGLKLPRPIGVGIWAALFYAMWAHVVRFIREGETAQNRGYLFVLTVAVSMMSLNIVLLTFGARPSWSLYPRYVGTMWVFISFWPAIILSRRLWLVALMALPMTLSLVAYGMDAQPALHRYGPLLPSEGEAVLLDTNYVGYVLPSAYGLSRTTPVGIVARDADIVQLLETAPTDTVLYNPAQVWVFGVDLDERGDRSPMFEARGIVVVADTSERVPFPDDTVYRLVVP